MTTFALLAAALFLPLFPASMLFSLVYARIANVWGVWLRLLNRDHLKGVFTRETDARAFARHVGLFAHRLLERVLGRAPRRKGHVLWARSRAGRRGARAGALVSRHEGLAQILPADLDRSLLRHDLFAEGLLQVERPVADLWVNPGSARAHAQGKPCQYASQ